VVAPSTASTGCGRHRYRLSSTNQAVLRRSLLFNINCTFTIGERPMDNLEEQRRLDKKRYEAERQLEAIKLEQLERVFRILQNAKDKGQDQ
jgi:hypothetical protein